MIYKSIEELTRTIHELPNTANTTVVEISPTESSKNQLINENNLNNFPFIGQNQSNKLNFTGTTHKI